MKQARRAQNPNVRAAVLEAPSTKAVRADDDVLDFDFDGTREEPARPAPRPALKDESIKQAIIKWLNQQL